MKAVFRFFSLFFSLLIILIVLLNISNTIAIETSFLTLKANVGFLNLSCTLLGSLITVLLLLSFGITVKSSESKLKKKFENAKLHHEIESDKMKQLEAKIKTLEEALRVATKS